MDDKLLNEDALPSISSSGEIHNHVEKRQPSNEELSDVLDLTLWVGQFPPLQDYWFESFIIIVGLGFGISSPVLLFRGHKPVI